MMAADGKTEREVRNGSAPVQAREMQQLGATQRPRNAEQRLRKSL